MTATAADLVATIRDLVNGVHGAHDRAVDLLARLDPDPSTCPSDEPTGDTAVDAVDTVVTILLEQDWRSGETEYEYGRDGFEPVNPGLWDIDVRPAAEQIVAALTG